MVRALLLALGIAWLVAGVGGLALAVAGTERLEATLPPLAIDTDALRGTIVAFSMGVLLVGAWHLAVLAGLRSHRPLAWTVGILGCALLAATMLALAATAATSAAAEPDRAPAFLAGGLGAVVGATAYALMAARLISERRIGGPDGPRT